MTRIHIKHLSIGIVALGAVWTTAALMAVGFVRCTSENQPAIPREPAYPRVNLYDRNYAAIDSVPVHFEACSGASTKIVKHEGDLVWVDIAYPHYRATLHCSINNEGRQLTDAVANRLERMALNAGDNAAAVDEWSTPMQWQATLMTTSGRCTTPLQFIATDGKTIIVSGALALHETSGEGDASPIIHAVTADLHHLINNLHER